MAAQALQATAALKAERKRTCAAEKQLKAANEAKAEAVAAAAKAAEEAAAGSMELDRARRLSEERAALVVQAENAAVEARQQCDVQVCQLRRWGNMMSDVSRHAPTEAGLLRPEKQSSYHHSHCQACTQDIMTSWVIWQPQWLTP